MTLTGYTDTVNGYNSVIATGELPDANPVKAVVPPIGSIVSWLKTYATADSGTTTSTSAGHLVQTGQNFQTTIDVGMIVRNTTDSTYTYVTAVNSDTDLTLNDDIITSGESYIIYKTPYLPDAWVECNGQVLSDSSSPYNGETIPDLNNAVEDTYGRYLRGGTTSGDTHGSSNKAHTHAIGFDTIGTVNGSYVRSASDSDSTFYPASDGTTEARVVSYVVVMIMRVK